MSYPVKRNLDSVYFRVKRDNRWDNVCFSDMTEAERYNVMLGQSEAWLREMCDIMANTLREVGDELDIIRNDEEDERNEHKLV